MSKIKVEIPICPQKIDTVEVIVFEVLHKLLQINLVLRFSEFSFLLKKEEINFINTLPATFLNIFIWKYFAQLFFTLFSLLSYVELPRIGYTNLFWHCFDTISIKQWIRYLNPRPFDRESGLLTTRAICVCIFCWKKIGKR